MIDEPEAKPPMYTIRPVENGYVIVERSAEPGNLLNCRKWIAANPGELGVLVGKLAGEALVKLGLSPMETRGD